MDQEALEQKGVVYLIATPSNRLNYLIQLLRMYGL